MLLGTIIPGILLAGSIAILYLGSLLTPETKPAKLRKTRYPRQIRGTR